MENTEGRAGLVASNDPLRISSPVFKSVRHHDSKKFKGDDDTPITHWVKIQYF